MSPEEIVEKYSRESILEAYRFFKKMEEPGNGKKLDSDRE